MMSGLKDSISPEMTERFVRALVMDKFFNEQRKSTHPHFTTMPTIFAVDGCPRSIDQVEWVRQIDSVYAVHIIVLMKCDYEERVRRLEERDKANPDAAALNRARLKQEIERFDELEKEIKSSGIPFIVVDQEGQYAQ